MRQAVWLQMIATYCMLLVKHKTREIKYSIRCKSIFINDTVTCVKQPAFATLLVILQARSKQPIRYSSFFSAYSHFSVWKWENFTTFSPLQCHHIHLLYDYAKQPPQMSMTWQPHSIEHSQLHSGRRRRTLAVIIILRGFQHSHCKGMQISWTRDRITVSPAELSSDLFFFWRSRARTAGNSPRLPTYKLIFAPYLWVLEVERGKQ